MGGQELDVILANHLGKGDTVKAKQQIKDLFIELVGEDDNIGNHDRETSLITPREINAYNQAKDQIRQKVEEL